MGQWERDVKEAKLIGFQQRIWRKIPAEDEEDDRLKGQTPKKASIRQRRWREKKKYEDYINELKRMKRMRKK